MGGRWFEDLPKVPLTRVETLQLKKNRMDNDELMVMRQLASLGSESPAIIVDPAQTREVITEAFCILREERTAQVTLASVLGATWYRIYNHRRRLPTR